MGCPKDKDTFGVPECGGRPSMVDMRRCARSAAQLRKEAECAGLKEYAGRIQCFSGFDSHTTSVKKVSGDFTVIFIFIFPSG